jgi:hypothetical protein
MTGKLFGNIVLKIIQRHIEGRNLLNARQFGFCEHHSTTAMYEASEPCDPTTSITK